MNEHRSALIILFYLVCCGIVYGSLFPFEFALRPERAVVDQFLVSWRTASGRGDILGNVALFIPYGLLAHVLFNLPGRKCGNTQYFVLVWLLVAVGSQLLQFFVPGRDPSVFDLYCNVAGTLLGWQLLRFIPVKMTSGLVSVSPVQQIALLLPLLWLASELIPFVPTIDLQAYKNAIKPLFLYPQWSWYDVLLPATSWFVCLYLLTRYVGVRMSWQRQLFGMIAVALLKIVIVKNSLSVTDVVAMILALAVWAPLGRRNLPPPVLAYALLFGFVMSSVFPFIPQPTPVTFGWIPFSGFLEGAMQANATALCQKLFVFGAIIFLTQQEERGWKKRSMLIALVLATVEFCQVWWASGTPEITDLVLFLGIAWFYASISRQRLNEAAIGGVKDLGTYGSLQESSTVRPSKDFPGLLSHGKKTVGEQPSASVSIVVPSGKKAVAIIVAIYCLLAIVALNGVLGIKGVPYNVRDLFGGRGDIFDFLFFSLALLSIGWGSAWLGRVLATTSRASLAVPGALLKLIIILYFLLWLSVSDESFRDILGANVFDRRLEDGSALGKFGMHLVRDFSRESVASITDIFEPIVRLAALIGPVFILAGLSLAVMQRQTWRSAQQWSAGRTFVRTCLWLFPWLYVCKYIAFDWAATDNITELIAREGALGLGGGAYLYLLVLGLMSLSAVLVWGYFSKFRARMLSFMILLASLPINWFLLNHGLEQNIVKYGRSFSAVNFLLGPDREGIIGGAELFLRWSLLQVVLVTGIAFSAVLYLRWSGLMGAVPPRNGAVRAAVKFRVYSHQWDFIHAQAGAMNVSVNELLHSIIAYFGREIAGSPANITVVQAYLDRSQAGDKVSLAPDAISVELTPEAHDVLALVDPDNVHSESRIFRKLLDIFMAVADEERG